MENSEIKPRKPWTDQAIAIYSSERLHWIDIRTYHQARVDEATAKISERTQLISDLEGKEPLQPELPLETPIIKEVPPFKFNPAGFIRHFSGKI